MRLVLEQLEGRLAPTADLSVALSASSNSVIAGNQLTYTAVVTNNGPDDATGVTLSDLLPTGATYVSSTTTQGTITAPGTVSAKSLSEDVYYTDNNGPNAGVEKVHFTYNGTTLTTSNNAVVARTGPADGLIFAPDGSLLAGGGTNVYKVNPSTGAYVTASPGTGAFAEELALDPSGTKVWTSGQPGEPTAIPLDPFGNGTPHPLTGDDTKITHIAFAPNGTAYYTSSAANGPGDFGIINLTTFTTKRYISDLPAAHGLVFDPFTGDLILCGSTKNANALNDVGHVTQINPETMQVMSDFTTPSGFTFDQGNVDGFGHLFASDYNFNNNTGHIFFVDYSSTGLIGAASNVYQNPQVDKYVDDVAPESGLGSNPAVVKDALGSLANGASATVTITVQVNPAEVGTFSDTATATGNQPLPSPAHNKATVTTNISYGADLAVTQTVSTTSALVASNVVFTVTVTNNGPSAASGITVSDPLPAGLDFVDYAGSQGSTYDSDTGIWTVGSLVPGASATLTLTASGDASAAGKSLINTATIVGADQPDTNPANNKANSPAVTITAKVTTAANNVSAVYSPNAQTVTLSASVADASVPTDTVDEGIVTFMVKNGSTTIGTAPGNVSNGTANASFTIPGGLAAGSYTIAVSYSDSTGNFIDSGDTNATLTVAAANVTTTANNVSAVYSPNAQTVKLTATVADANIPTDTVDEGTVTFTVKNGSTTIGTAQDNVSGGKVNASFSLPAGQALGSYTITVSYSDSNGNFTDGGDTNGSLTITAAKVTTAANNVSVAYSPNAQTVTLTASVADASIPTDTVDEGAVAFAVKNGGTTIGTAQGNVSNGKANASFTLPAGQAVGSYTIAVSYSDSTGNFVDSGDTNATLGVQLAPVVTTNPSSQTITAGQNVTFTATANGTPAPTVQWQASTDGGKTFTNISGATSTTLTLANVSAVMDGYEYQAVFTNSAGSITTSTATLTVQYAPLVTTNPTSQTVTAGQNTTFTTAAAGNPTPTVQWQVSSDGGKTFTNINGATSPTLTLTNVSFSLNGHEYRAVFLNTLGTATTTAVNLTVQTTAAITSGNSALFTVGQGGNFTVTATGSPTPTFTESGALPGGITFTDNGNGTATLAGAPAVGTQGTYQLTIAAHNGAGSDFTQSFTLKVNPAPVPPSPPFEPPSPLKPPTLNVPPLLALLDSLLGSIEVVNANGTETVTASLFGISLIVATYDASGNFVGATLLGLSIPNSLWSL